MRNLFISNLGNVYDFNIKFGAVLIDNLPVRNSSYVQECEKKIKPLEKFLILTLEI